MKKLLVASSALVAATAFAGAAQAADPIKLTLGGFGYAAVTYYDNDDTFLGAREVNNFVVTGDNEVHIKGSTTLDNGLTVAVKYELRTGGQGTGSNTNNVDEWSVTTSGSFGSVILGAEDAATEAVAIMAPHMGGRLLGAGLSEGSMIGGAFVQNPGVQVINASFINTNDEQLISYISPNIAGFTFGASYVPGVGNGQDTMAQIAALNVADVYGAGLKWAGEFDAVGIEASLGYATGDMSNATAATFTVNPATGVPTPVAAVGNTVDDWHQWQAGLGFSYAGFTLSGGYTQATTDITTANVSDIEQTAWEVGVGYKTGPYGVALGYFSSTVENGAAGLNEDEADVWQLTSQYTMGPGVMLVGGVAWADFDNNEVGAANVNNDGLVVQTGVMLSF